MAGKSLPIPVMQTLRLALEGPSFGGLGKFVHRKQVFARHDAGFG
jgi:hypothetical protein